MRRVAVGIGVLAVVALLGVAVEVSPATTVAPPVARVATPEPRPTPRVMPRSADRPRRPARAAPEPEIDDRHTCELDPGLASASAFFLTDSGERRAARVVDGTVRIAGDEALGNGVLVVAGYAPARIDWLTIVDRTGDFVGKQVCEAGRLPLVAGEAETATIVATVRNTRGEAWIAGCGLERRVDADGVLSLEVLAQPCTLRAERHDGGLVVKTDAVDVDPEPDEASTVDLVLPSYRKAGLGVSLEVEADGIVVHRVIPGTPAEAAGLAPGDEVVSIDGVSTAGMDFDEFVDRATGPAGDPVELVVRAGDDVRTLVLHRQPFDDPPDR